MAGSVTVALLVTVTDPVAAAVAVALVPAGLLAADIDTATLRLPDPLTLGCYRPVAVIEVGGALLDGQYDRLPVAAALSALCLLALAIPAWFGMVGFGDVKLAGLLGLAVGRLGPSAVVLFLLIGHLIGGGLALRALRRGSGHRSRVPFGPALLVGGATAMALCG